MELKEEAKRSQEDHQEEPGDAGEHGEDLQEDAQREVPRLRRRHHYQERAPNDSELHLYGGFSMLRNVFVLKQRK